jgi:hypothetical protein
MNPVQEKRNLHGKRAPLKKVAQSGLMSLSHPGSSKEMNDHLMK